MLYEVALYDWGLTPEYINETWSDELLYLMFDARRERLEQKPKKVTSGKHWNNPDELFRKMASYGSQAVTVEKG